MILFERTLTFLLDLWVKLCIITQVSRDSNEPSRPRTPDTLAECRSTADFDNVIDLSAVRELCDFLIPFWRGFVVDRLDGIRSGARSDEWLEEFFDLGKLVVGRRGDDHFGGRVESDLGHDETDETTNDMTTLT